MAITSSSTTVRPVFTQRPSRQAPVGSPQRAPGFYPAASTAPAPAPAAAPAPAPAGAPAVAPTGAIGSAPTSSVPPPAPAPAAPPRPTYPPPSAPPPGYSPVPPYGPTRAEEPPPPVAYNPYYYRLDESGNPVLGQAPRLNPYNARQAQLLGPELGAYIGTDISAPIMGKNEYQFLQARLNYENILRAEEDRRRGYDTLSQAYTQVGQSPESTFAREMAAYRLANPDILNPQEVSMQEAAIRARGARGYQDTLMQLQQDQAARGIGGPIGGYELAQLNQGYDRQIADELQNQALQLAFAREEREKGALGTLSQISTDEEVRRMAILQALADAFLQTERGPIDLAGLG